MIVTATLLIVVGVLASLLGVKLFRLLLPVLGFVTGFMVGFMGFQGIFGTGAVSSIMAVVIALVVGLVVGVLSFLFFEMAAALLMILLGSMVFSYLGVALGLDREGFLVFLLAVAGAIFMGMYALRRPVSMQLVLALTSLLGVAYILTGFMLISGNVELSEVHDTGVVRTLLRVVDQSFLWFFVWLGGSLLAMRLQQRLLVANAVSDMFAYVEQNNSKKR